MTDSTVEETKVDLFKRLEEEWFKEILPPVEKFEDYVQRSEGQGGPDGVRHVYHFFSDTHRYHVVAKVGADGHTYLGCQASQRKPYAGEDHTRGSDLPDGPFTKETWDEIVRAIVGRELMQLWFTKRPFRRNLGPTTLKEEVPDQPLVDVESGPVEGSSHDFSFGRSDGYGVCKCGVRENTVEACVPCELCGTSVPCQD